MSLLSYLQTALEYPAIAQCIKQTLAFADYVWLGHTSKFVTDEIFTVWSTDTTQIDIRNVPQFHPISLQYMYLLICYYCQLWFSFDLLTQTQFETVSSWSPYIPKVFSDRTIVYYARGAQWLYLADSEIEWAEARSALHDWIGEHKGKQGDDATWNILSIFKKTQQKTEDVTNELFVYMAPGGNFISKEHLRRLTTDVIIMETLEGDSIEI